MSNPKIIIVDLDGTLANCEHRVHHLQREPKNWDSFYQGLGKDQLNQWCLDLINGMGALGIKCIIVTGRGEKCRSETSKWLLKNDIKYEQMYMRPSGDFREDSLIKKEIYLTELQDQYEVSFVLEDRLSVVKMWRELGLTCLQCDWGDF